MLKASSYRQEEMCDAIDRSLARVFWEEINSASSRTPLTRIP